jgi:putative acetyltransferase
MPIAIEIPDQPEVRQLISELDTYLLSLYPAENVYALDLASLLAANVLFAVARDAAGVTSGCAAIVRHAEYAEIKRMYVRPASRGQGVARQLIGFLEQKAAEYGCRRFLLETGPSNPEALDLYQRMGYQRCGAFGDYPEHPLSVFMEKRVESCLGS